MPTSFPTISTGEAWDSGPGQASVLMNQITAAINALENAPTAGPSAAGFFGDGSDGNVTISGTTTLSQDMFYDTLTINSGGTLITANLRVYCKTALIVNSGGVIQNNGTNATSSSNAIAPSPATLGAGGNGGAGGTTSGSNTATITNALGGGGGQGGNGSSGSGSAAGAITTPSLLVGNLRAAPFTTTGQLVGNGVVVLVKGGQGGGGGGGDGTAGGGGGSGAGVLVINARSVTNNGTISANGGAGFLPTAGNRGGGAGGGGGVVVVNTGAYTGSNPTAAGGTGASGTGTGTAGTNGSAGFVLKSVWT